MSFTNRSRVRGKSIRDHMADAILLGLTAVDAARYVQAKCAARISRRHLLEIHSEMMQKGAGLTGPAGDR